ncbi:hypothetical protein FHS30_001949 [Simiduia aestuariiviva]|uniref:MSHA biogenesis protein MshK n=1 Tax=Simiduia aestuariiviva TaxID=1510459 RepID=A0A839UTT1_9GAMM|nr:hypothetical protein [Simiduia aestuariiviva]
MHKYLKTRALIHALCGGFGRYVCALCIGFSSLEGWAQPPSLSDPTRPLNYRATATAQQGYQLSSIFLSEQRARAIINGQLVGVGDRVGAAKVARIEAGQVVLQTPDGVKSLRLHTQIKRAKNTP